MSLTIYLISKEKTKVDCECEHCGNKHQYENQSVIIDRNITHNLGKMAAECGVYPYIWRHDENGVKKAADLINPIDKGLTSLLKEPEKFKKFEAENGWGRHENLVSFLIELLQACQENPEATVHVWK